VNLIRVVEVDDWAWRKGHVFGTILVDLDAGRVLDVLPDRSSQSVANWLGRHPEVEIVSRDRHGLYAEGARQGAPQARQVADRVHLLDNLRERLEKQLKPSPAVLSPERSRHSRRRLAVAPHDEGPHHGCATRSACWLVAATDSIDIVRSSTSLRARERIGPQPRLGQDPSTSLKIRRAFHLGINDLSASHLVLSEVEGHGGCSNSLA
jgi:transposase